MFRINTNIELFLTDLHGFAMGYIACYAMYPIAINWSGLLRNGLYRYTLSVVKRMENHLVGWAYDVDYRLPADFRVGISLPMQWRQRITGNEILASGACAGSGNEKTDR